MTAIKKLKAADITGSFAMIRFDCDICENTRTSDELSVELRGQLIKKGTDRIKVHVFDKKTGDKLRAKREKLRRYLQERCVQYGDQVFLVKREKVQGLMADCENIISEFHDLLDDYCAQYNTLLDNHLNSLEGDLYTVARALCYSQSQWKGRNTLGMAPTMLMQGISDDDNERLVEDIASASLKDIKRSVDQIYRELFWDKDGGKLKNSTTTTAIKKLEALSDKVAEIAMVKEGLGNISGYVRDVLTAVPVPTGDKGIVIEGHGFSMLLNLMMLLKDEDMLRACANDARNLPAIDQDEDWFKEESSLTTDNAASDTPDNVVTPSTTQIEPGMDDMFASADEFEFD